ncbi:MAG: helix-turn-helix domain-containing protein [Myxococcota bacterium]
MKYAPNNTDRISVRDRLQYNLNYGSDYLPVMDYRSIIERFIQIRESQGLDQKDVARRMGLSTGSISHKETGRRQAALDELTAWADALGCELRVELHEQRPRPQDKLAEAIREIPTEDVEFVRLLLLALPELEGAPRRRLKALILAYAPEGVDVDRLAR